MAEKNASGFGLQKNKLPGWEDRRLFPRFEPDAETELFLWKQTPDSRIRQDYYLRCRLLDISRMGFQVQCNATLDFLIQLKESRMRVFNLGESGVERSMVRVARISREIKRNLFRIGFELDKPVPMNNWERILHRERVLMG